MFNQFPRITLTSGSRFGTEIDKIPSLALVRCKSLKKCVMQERDELFVEAGLAFRGELIPEPPHATSEEGEPIVAFFAWGHPICSMALISLDYLLQKSSSADES